MTNDNYVCDVKYITAFSNRMALDPRWQEYLQKLLKMLISIRISPRGIRKN